MSREHPRLLQRELIDTLWNVNTSAAEEPSGDAQGINRYIMECKCAMSLEESASYTN